MTLPGFSTPLPVLPMQLAHQNAIVGGRKTTTLRRKRLAAGVYKLEGKLGTVGTISAGGVRVLDGPVHEPLELWVRGGELRSDDVTGPRLMSWPELLKLEGYAGDSEGFCTLVRKWHPGWLLGEYPLWLHWLEFVGLEPDGAADPATGVSPLQGQDEEAQPV